MAIRNCNFVRETWAGYASGTRSHQLVATDTNGSRGPVNHAGLDVTTAAKKEALVAYDVETCYPATEDTVRGGGYQQRGAGVRNQVQKRRVLRAHEWSTLARRGPLRLVVNKNTLVVMPSGRQRTRRYELIRGGEELWKALSCRVNICNVVLYLVFVRQKNFVDYVHTQVCCRQRTLPSADFDAIG